MAIRAISRSDWVMTMSKYKSRKITKDGMVFDSLREYKRYTELALLEKVGQISDLQRQEKFVLIPAQYEYVPDKKDGKLKRKCVERECAYYADFTYWKDGYKVVEDTKGFRTKDYIIKRKLMRYMNDIAIVEI